MRVATIIGVAVCLTLLGALFVVWDPLALWPNPATPALSAQPSSAAGALAKVAASDPLATLASMRESEARPLFEPLRRPFRPPVKQAPTPPKPKPAPTPAPAVHSAPPLPALTAAILDGNVKIAFLRDAATATTKPFKAGETAFGWRVLAIDAASVRLGYGGRQQTVQLRPDTGAAAAPSASSGPAVEAGKSATGRVRRARRKQ